jgi:IS30 family transposase
MEKKRIKTMRSWTVPTQAKVVRRTEEYTPKPAVFRSHVTFEERVFIQESIKQGLAILKIAQLMNRSESVLHRELLRVGKKKDYDAYKAQAHRDAAHYRRYPKQVQIIHAKSEGLNAD